MSTRSSENNIVSLGAKYTDHDEYETTGLSALATLRSRTRYLEELSKYALDDDDVLDICVLTIAFLMEFILKTERERISKEERKEERWDVQRRERLVRMRARHGIRLRKIRATHAKQLPEQLLKERAATAVNMSATSFAHSG